MTTRSAKRIMVLTSGDCPVLDVIKDLTGSAPQPDESSSVSGLVHEWEAKTQYYEATVTIWLDDVSDLDAWRTSFTAPEAREARDAIGVWVYCFPRQADGQVPEFAKQVMKTIAEDVLNQRKVESEFLPDDVWSDADLADADLEAAYPTLSKLALAVPAKGTQGAHGSALDYEKPDTDCLEYGFEYIAYGDTGTDEFGDKVGLERLKERLETDISEHLVDGGDDANVDDLIADLDENVSADGIAREEAALSSELFGLRAALGDGPVAGSPEEGSMSQEGQAAQVDDLGEFMSKLSMLREQNASLPEKDRKKMAAQAVRKLMREHPSV